jgi:hypothetical protein
MIAPVAPNGEIPVRNPKSLAVEALPVERVAVGVPEDYKPCIALLPGGELLMCAFFQEQLGDGQICEYMVFYRSSDGGKAWPDREVVPMLGREPYFSMSRRGTLFITTHLLDNDIRNPDGAVHSYLHRSSDGGRTWETLKLAPADLPGAADNAWVHTSRNVLELADGTLVFGVSAPGGVDYLWRSRDEGKTWDRSLRCAFEGVDAPKLWWPFMAETVLWQAPDGDLLGLWRVDPALVPPLPGSAHDSQAEGDQIERMVVFRSRDGGANWTREPELGSDYGDMYPGILGLRDGRLLLTFTVRALHPPLGVHAVFGRQTPDGFAFDFAHDRLVIDAKTPEDQISGGGFGNTLQLADETLVTAYSYRSADGKVHLEVARWRLPQ